MGVMTIEVEQSFASQIIEKQTREVTIAGINLGKRQILQANEAATSTATGTVTLDDDDLMQQYIDPGGADRDVNLPSPSINNHGFLIKNIADAWEKLNIKSGTNLLCVLHKNEAAWFGSNISSWHLAGKINEIRDFEFIAIAAGSFVPTGDGAGQTFQVPKSVDKKKMVYIRGMHNVKGAGAGTTTIQIANVTQGVDMLSTELTIDTDETDSSTAAAAAVINPDNATFNEGDLIRIDIDGVPATTSPKGLMLTFGAQH